jgi:lincosamide nucleotidyltransferase A/C/D/E
MKMPRRWRAGGHAIHRFVTSHRLLWVPAGWLSRAVASAPESSPIHSVLGPLRDHLRGAMKLEDVLSVLSALQAQNVPVCLAGGWGVDAILGRQTRSHDDLDVVIDDYEHQLDRAVDALAPLGFRLTASYERRAWMPRIAELEDDAGRRVDLNSLDWQRLADEVGPPGADPGSRHAFEHLVFTDGTLGGRRVPCLSADVQLLYHTAFELSTSHQQDLALLRGDLGEPGPGPSTKPKARERARRGRPRGTPSVVFVDDCRWNAFHQLAPRLRRAGVRTIRVSTEGRRKTRVASWLLFDRYKVVSDGSVVEGLRDILASENVVDIQFAESLGWLVRDNIDLLSAALAQQVGRRLTVLDKLETARLLAAAGVRTPAAVRVEDASPEEAAERFGFPVVVKESVGYGGERVRIARDIEDLVAAVSGWGGHDHEVFYEQYIEGIDLDYAAVVSGVGIEQELAYRVTRRREPVGGASEVVTVEDTRLIAFARRALDVVGCTGMVNMDIIRDEDGFEWLIDFNARAFGGSASFLAAGIDVSEGYLKAIGERPTPPTSRSAVAGMRIRVFPTCLEDVIDSGSVTRSALAFLRGSFPYLRWLGFRYWLSEALLTADAVRLSRREAATRSASIPPAKGPTTATTRKGV